MSHATYTPCKVNLDGTRAVELAPVCGMTWENAMHYACRVWAEDAGVLDDATNFAEWVGDSFDPVIHTQ